MKRFFYLILITTLSLSTLIGCRKISGDDNVVDKEAKAFLNSAMTEYYYWYKEIPTTLAVTPTTTIFDYFDAMLVKKDRWSWMTTGKQWNESETGVYVSYGASIGQPVEYFNDYDLRVRYVHQGSPFDKIGVKRGWTLTHVGGVEVMTLIKNKTFNTEYGKPQNSFTFRDLEGKLSTYDVTATTISTRSYLKAQVFTSQDFKGLTSPVGYFNYLTFNANMLEDIDNAFTLFKNNGVKEVVLDLRYNGGGDSRATSLLANYLAPQSAEGKILVFRQHNDKHPELNKKSEVPIKRAANALNLSRLFVITGSGTASASEIIINGLQPFMEVISVGDTTYGKPNGMYAFPYPEGTEKDYYGKAEYVYLPICFYSVNSKGDGNYEDGIIPTKYSPDDLYTDWGTQEYLTKACLTYITSGSFPALPTRPKALKEETPGAPIFKGRIPLPEDAKGYGKDIVRLR